MAKKQPLIERFQQLAGIKPLYENDDDWQKRQDALTPGKNPDAFYKDFDKVKAAANNGEIEISLEDLDFETLKEAFPNNYQQVKFTRPQTDEPYYSDSISFPNLDDSTMEIGDSSALEDWKDKVNRRFGNVTIILKPDGKNWFDKVFVDDEKFNQERDNFISGKMSALNR